MATRTPSAPTDERCAMLYRYHTMEQKQQPTPKSRGRANHVAPRKACRLPGLKARPALEATLRPQTSCRPPQISCAFWSRYSGPSAVAVPHTRTATYLDGERANNKQRIRRICIQHCIRVCCIHLDRLRCAITRISNLVSLLQSTCEYFCIPGFFPVGEKLPVQLNYCTKFRPAMRHDHAAHNK